MTEESMGLEAAFEGNEGDAKYKDLLEAAARALCRENAELEGLFEKRESEYRHVSQGLGYWLYETTLVYVIFKAWIPLAKVEWDWPEKDREKRRVDLRTLAPHKAYFEAKWCNAPGAERGMEHDAKKLKELGGDGDRYVLAFWWDEEEKKDKNRRWIDEQRESRPDLQCAYWARFPTRIAHGASFTERKNRREGRSNGPRAPNPASSGSQPSA